MLSISVFRDCFHLMNQLNFTALFHILILDFNNKTFRLAIILYQYLIIKILLFFQLNYITSNDKIYFSIRIFYNSFVIQLIKFDY